MCILPATGHVQLVDFKIFIKSVLSYAGHPAQKMPDLRSFFPLGALLRLLGCALSAPLQFQDRYPASRVFNRDVAQGSDTVGAPK